MCNDLSRYCGKQAGQYRIDRPLGQGRYGACFLAHAPDGSPVVIKRFKPAIFRRNAEKNAYEAVILSQLGHPCIPGLLGVVNEKGLYGFVLEYKPGITVEAMLYKQKHRFSGEEIYRIGTRLIRIIGYLHRNGAVHRDIRASNVLLYNDDIYLVDFGLARWADTVRYRFDVDFAFFGDFLLHLMYSTYPKKQKKALPWHRELEMTDAKRQFLKKLMKLEQPYVGIADVENDFLSCFAKGIE